MSKLPPEFRDRVEFGIERIGANGQRLLVQSSYSRVGNLVDVESGRYVKLQDIAGLAVIAGFVNDCVGKRAPHRK